MRSFRAEKLQRVLGLVIWGQKLKRGSVVQLVIGKLFFPAKK